jgi:hypothetical protein
MIFSADFLEVLQLSHHRFRISKYLKTVGTLGRLARKERTPVRFGFQVVPESNNGDWQTLSSLKSSV